MLGLAWMFVGALINPGTLDTTQITFQVVTCMVLLYVIVRATAEMDRIRIGRIKSRLQRRHDD